MSLILLGDACSAVPSGPGRNGVDEAAFHVDINDPEASDSNPGTAAAPWKTLRKAVETLTAGQTVYVKNGTYNERAG